MSEPDDQTTPTFPLLKLPFLPLKDTVKGMDVMDICKLSLSSKTNYALLKFMNLKTSGFEVYIGTENSSIRFFGNEKYSEAPIQLFYSKKEDKPKGLPENTVLNLVPDQIDECLFIANNLSKLFRMNRIKFIIPSHSNKNLEEITHFLSKMLSGSYTELLFYGFDMIDGGYRRKFIDGEVLEYLMNNVKIDSSLALKYFFPKNFSHENAFKFRKVEYSDASWVTMETLTSLRNAGSISLSNLNFDSKNLNEFIKYWINCEEDMMEEITMNINEQTIEDEVLDELITLNEIDNGKVIHLIKTRNTESRKRILRKLTFSRNLRGIILETMKPTEQYEVKLEILELMEKEKDLENELREIEENESKTKNGSMDMERKEAIQVELAEIRKKLLNLEE